jgi:hypothetical protein
MASTTVFGFPVYSDVGVLYSPAFSAGSWLAALPLANVQDARLAYKARSSDALATSTTFDIDLGATRDVGVLAILIPNLTKSAVPTIQWKVSTVSNFATTVYDSTAYAPWPTSQTAEDVDGLNVWLIKVPSSVKTGRYVRCAIIDTANVDGYLDVARVIVAGAYRPTYGISYGAKLALEVATIPTDTDGGATIYNERPIRRGYDFALNNVAESEAMANIFKMQRLLGTSRQLFFVLDETATTYLHEQSYLCTIRELGALEFAYATRYGIPFRLREVL